MIKRSGIELMNKRTKDVSIANETLGVIANGNYTAPSGTTIDISAQIKAAIEGTIFYPDPLPFKDCSPAKEQFIEVVNETTAQAAMRLLEIGRQNIVALNFAAARNVGGGFLGGAQAQEEDLCRASALYGCLKNKPLYYNANILCEDTYYTDGMLYSPKVPFFRDPFNFLLEEPFELSIITAPAPNISGLKTGLWGKVDQKKLATCIFHRTQKICQIAEKHGHTSIILGAFGCGAFGNDPEQMSQAFKEALQDIPVFEHIIFAVYDQREGAPVYQTFKDKFNG